MEYGSCKVRLTRQQYQLAESGFRRKFPEMYTLT